MKLYYAPYPSLENSLVHFVQTHRSNVLDKWLIIGSSSLIIEQLQTRLARELGALANIHFITAGGLVGKLDQEAGGETDPLFPQSHLRDFLIKDLLTRPGLDRYPVSRGFVQVVKSALRDLADSLADPDVLEEHLRSMPDFVLQQDNGRFAWLIKLYREYCQAENNVPGYRSYQTAFERALAQVDTSSYLHDFTHILVYGFYDMPGRQLELITRLQSVYPLTVFAPYAQHPAYQFAKKFFETNWLRFPGAENVAQTVPSALGPSADFLFANQGSAPSPGVRLVSVPDEHGAVFFVAKEILRLKQQGHSLQDIAVIARSLSAYQDEIRRVFTANCLPLNASFTYSISHYALGLFCQQLLSLARHGFAREQVLSVVSSAYFKQPRKTEWKRVLNRSLAQRDLAQWRDLLPQTQGYEPDLLAWLEQTASQLSELEKAQPWQTGAKQVLSFLEAQLDVAALRGKEIEIYQTICNAIHEIAAYQAVRPSCRPGELLEEVLEALAGLSFNEVENWPGGVLVTDAVRARGLSFKTVFVLGLNDQEFPLIMQEDPVLRDYYRFMLRDTLGYWINGSLDRIDEEKLLFYSVVCSAREHLYALVARYTADGKPAVPSVYAAQLARACELDWHGSQAIRVSGRLSSRLQSCAPELLCEKEISSQFSLNLATASENYQTAGLLTAEKSAQLAAAGALCKMGELGEFDGQIQSGAQAFVQANKKGFSPSALQEIATCPLKYFFNRVVKLGEPEEPLSRHELPADLRGTAYHEVLNDFYQILLTQQLPHTLSRPQVEVYLTRALAAHYTPTSYKVFGIYPVIWEMILEDLHQKLADFIEEDLQNLGPFTPSRFEWKVQTEPTEQLPLHLYGIIDRVDIDESAKAFRIVDYKSSRKGTAHLDQDFFTHLIFQPFLYTYMAGMQPALASYQSAGACLLAIASYKKSDLSPEEYRAMYPRAVSFLKQLIGLIEEGSFFVNPSSACTYCPYGLLCRRDAFKTLLRARKSRACQELEEARR
ncbi:MAG: exodeoxyribonuclease V subunit gamma [Elusimicrobiaceae bacterium]|nr:exodeoxyribonuclease V subunit gamma [Elusimicrobiaceae bacterium]